MFLLFLRDHFAIKIIQKAVVFYPTDNEIDKRSIALELDPGAYQFEVWGAQGGKGAENKVVTDKARGGKGAYASTYIRFVKKMKIYCYFGQQGSQADPYLWAQGRSAFNGGGAGGYHYWKQQTHTAGGGGGGTDCRLYPGDISNETSRNSRFVVAGGGSGGGGNCPGAPGGGFYPFRMHEPKQGVYEKLQVIECLRSGIGADGAPYNSGNGGYKHSFSGAGGGFYGGIASQNSDRSTEAISRSGTSWGLGCDIPRRDGPSQFVVKSEDKVLIPLDVCTVRNGDEDFPSPNDLSATEKGHEGNGAVRISHILLGNLECTNGQVKVVKKRNHGVFFSLLETLAI